MTKACFTLPALGVPGGCVAVLLRPSVYSHLSAAALLLPALSLCIYIISIFIFLSCL